MINDVLIKGYVDKNKDMILILLKKSIIGYMWNHIKNSVMLNEIMWINIVLNY